MDAKQEHADPTSGAAIYELKKTTDLTWPEIGERLGIHHEAARKRSITYAKQNGLDPVHIAKANWTATSTIDDEPKQTPEEIWSRAISINRRRIEKGDWKQRRAIKFETGPVVLLAIADLHLGSGGVDYAAIDQDISLINGLHDSGVQVAVLLVGDLIDNYIIGRLKDLRMTGSPFLTVEEWGLCDYALTRLAPFLIGSVAGNHDNWSWALSGIDLLREVHKKRSPGILYDPYELSFDLIVGDHVSRVVARHKWRGNSMYNPTHGMEHRHHTQGRPFDIGIAAHTHRGGLAREMSNGDRIAYGLMCGSYKKQDQYADMLGLPPALPTTAVAVVVDETGIDFATSNVHSLPKYLGIRE